MGQTEYMCTGMAEGSNESLVGECSRLSPVSTVGASEDAIVIRGRTEKTRQRRLQLLEGCI
jgi:hypothetical protein